jgi:hypothetical protein
MTEQPIIGIDINGLIDALAVGWPATVTQGTIPSVVVPVSQRGRAIVVIAGAEASAAIEGRGWRWPPAAHHLASRLSVADALARLQARGKQLQQGELAPGDLLAAAVDALAPRALAHDPVFEMTVLAVPDNDRLDEDVRQVLLDSFARRRRRVTLLWRSIAAFLGVEPELRPHSRRLAGKRVGLISIDGSGIEATAFEVEAVDGGRASYLVPVRRRAGVRVDFATTLFDRAIALAATWLPEDELGAHQLVWGNGLAIRKLLGLPAGGPVVVQRNGKWAIVDGDSRVTGSLPQFAPSDIDALNAAIAGCAIVVFEGPGLYARDAGEQLVHRVRERLQAPQVFYQPPHRFYAAEGCAAFAWRRLKGWRTYFDFLPQLRISARVEGEARFLALIPPEARVEGGEEYRPERVDLGFMLRRGAQALKVFLVKEGESRFASLEFPVPPEEDVRIGIDVAQRPAQGRARLTLVPVGGGALVPLELDWRAMAIDSRDEATILADLNDTAGRVPPTVVVKAHPLLWVRRRMKGESLVELLSRADGTISAAQLKDHLYRSDSPSRITRGASEDGALYRVVGTDGSVPDPTQGVSGSDIAALDNELTRLAAMPGSEVACSWAFARCPPEIAERLQGLAKVGNAGVGGVNAMGRVFTEDHQFDTFFGYLARVPEFKQHHIMALLSVLSLREGAARRLKSSQADAFAKQASRVLAIELGKRNFQRRCRATIKLLAALMRYRLNSPQFLTPGQSDLSQKVEASLGQIKQRAPDRGTVALATAALEFLHDRGTDTTILDYDPDDE